LAGIRDMYTQMPPTLQPVFKVHVAALCRNASLTPDAVLRREFDSLKSSQPMAANAIWEGDGATRDYLKGDYDFMAYGVSRVASLRSDSFEALCWATFGKQ